MHKNVTVLTKERFVVCTREIRSAYKFYTHSKTYTQKFYNVMFIVCSDLHYLYIVCTLGFSLGFKFMQHGNQHRKGYKDAYITIMYPFNFVGS